MIHPTQMLQKLRRTLAPAVGLWIVASMMPLPAGAARIAYVNVTLHPIASAEIAGGALVVENGRIVELLPSAPAADAGFEIVDLGGLHLWPGLIAAASSLGLDEISSVRGTDDTTEIGDFNPDLRAEVAFHPDSRRIPPALAGGILTAHVIPDGTLFRGSSAAMRLAGWTWEQMTLAAPVAQHLDFPRVVKPASRWPREQTDEEFKKDKEEALRRLADYLGAARGYHRARTAFENGEGPAIDVEPKYEAFRAVLSGRVPLCIWADERNQIEQALDWAKAEGLTRIVLVANSAVVAFAERLASARIPVILRGIHSLPAQQADPYDMPFTAAAQLHAAGVRFAFTDGGDSSNARNLPFEAATAVSFGLPREAAHRAMTLDAAEILGIADRVGALAPGLEATFFAATGDPLDIRTSIERVFIRGDEIDLAQDPQRQLWERYRNRPATEAAR